MRTFSRLKALCSFPDSLPEKPSKRRDDAAALGSLLHKAVEVWVHTGEAGHFDGLPEPVRGWARLMRERWTPPAGCETEVALGLADLPLPKHVNVLEDPPDSHKYRAIDGRTPVLTAGRADLIWTEDALVRVADIKTGQFYLGDPARLRQVLAQGFAAWERDGKCEGFVPGVYYARTGCFDWAQAPLLEGTTAWREAWRWVLEAARRDTLPVPGGHCLSCWDRKFCPQNPVVETP